MKKFFNGVVDTLILVSLVFFVFISCKKITGTLVDDSTVDLGKTSALTAIKTFSQTNNTVTVEFATTPGAKYSVQITPFGSDVPVKTDGFTATDTVTKKVFVLDELAKKNYDLHILDIQGKEDKHPITIK